MSKEHNSFESELIAQVKEAAKEGAKEGVREFSGKGAKGGFLHGVGSMFGSFLFKVLLLALVVMLIIPKLNPFTHIGNLFNREDPVENHDLTLENKGILGYTVADFADAIIDNQSQLKKIEVYEVSLSDVATITKTGLIKLSAFTKSQLITYHGTVVYTVDLSKLTKSNVSLDEESKVITLVIPHPEQEEINIPSKEIEYGDVEKGLLSFGDLKASPEETAAVETAAQERMEKKLVEDKQYEKAKDFAKMAVWEIYQPIINDVAEGYSLNIEFVEP